MKKLSSVQKLKWAKVIGSLYFLLLGLINFGATLYHSSIHALDFTILLLGCLPIIFKRKEFSLVFGILAALIAVYMGIAALTFNLNPEVKTTQLAFNMGYLLVFSMLLSSFFLIYAGSSREYTHHDKVLTGE